MTTTLIYKLRKEKIEPLTDLNNEYYPVTEKSNQFTGALYYQDGVNYTKPVNSISPSALEVNTGKRVIKTDKVDITDCAYKKHYEGLDLIEYGQGKNKLSSKYYVNNWFNSADDNMEHTNIKYSIYYVPILPNRTYTISCTTDINRKQIRYLDKDFKILKSFSESGGNYTSYTLPTPPSGTRYLCMYINSMDITNLVLQLEEGTVATSYEPYIKGYTTFENIQENDVTDLRHLCSLTGFNYQSIMEQSFDKLLRGEL